MSVVNRQSLGDGTYRRVLALPDHLALTDAQVEQSLQTTLTHRPGGPVWIFGYGSLMFNPVIAFDAKEVATLEGWHRSFCLRSVSGRGSEERPGRMLSLEVGGRAKGVAYRLSDDSVASELRLLWAREMSSGAYRPLWLPVQLASGPTVSALTFVANAEHPSHDSDACVATVARSVAGAVGIFGSNLDYVRAIDNALDELSIDDPYVSAVVRALTDLGAQ